MKLNRLEVHGGFLDGIDVEFSDGLNVLIGARGSGKTSVIELVRYCLNVPAVTDEADQDAREHAYNVLGDGEVTVTAELGGNIVVVRRSAEDDAPRVEPSVDLEDALFVSQNEIEAIGMDATSRRRILDGLADGGEVTDAAEVGAGEQAEAAAKQVEALATEREDLLNRLRQIEEVPERLKAEEDKQRAASKEGEELAALQTELADLSDSVGRGRERETTLERAIAALDDWLEELRVARDAMPRLPKLPLDDADALLGRLREGAEAVKGAETTVAEVRGAVEEERAKLAAELLSQQRRLRAIGERTEELQEGAGELARTIGSLRQQMQERGALENSLKSLDESLAKLTAERGAALDQLDRAREDRYQRRVKAAEEVNTRFAGEIEARVSKASALSGYESALAGALTNSGLQYKALARDIAPRMSPRELVEAVDRDDAQYIADAGAITSDRANRLISHLRANGTTSVLLAPIDDVVDFALLDGQDFKTTANLSMGQRCTVVLPLLLAQQRQVTVLDQPEDHLDNAFIVETVVRALQERPEDAQLLVATHNANIPVLGNADNVVVMGSTGRRGFVDHTGQLDDDEVVSKIKRLMEGGEKAFAQRASFYDDHKR